MTKTPGQIAYEANLSEFSKYPYGGKGEVPPPAWEEASDLARRLWERAEEAPGQVEAYRLARQAQRLYDNGRITLPELCRRVAALTEDLS